MVTLIKQYTGCRILVGQNGLVWIQGDEPDMELLTVNAIKKIEREAHLSGLTDSVKAYLEKRAGPPKAAPIEEEGSQEQQ